MTAFRKKLATILEGKFGVSSDFLEHLLPILERIAEQRPTAEEWEEMLQAVSAAYRTSVSQESRTLEEVNAIAAQVSSELRKMDESLKVLGAYLDRVRQTMSSPPESRLLH